MANNYKGKGKRTKNSPPKDRRTSGGKGKMNDRDNCDFKRKRDDEFDMPREKGMNDISWYDKNPNLLLAAGSIPYPYRPGMKLNLGSVKFTSTATTATPLEMNIPGVMALGWAPSVGISNSATDPASVAAKEIYAKVRAKYSGALEVDAPDFMMYLMALDSIYAYIAYLKRVYRTINAYTPQNYELPDTALKAMGFSETQCTELRQNKTMLWQNINTLVLQSRKFTCPAIMDIFNRHYWMSDNVYMDAPTINSQLYIFKPTALFEFTEEELPSGGTASALQYKYLTWYSVTKGNLIPTMYNFGLTMVDALVAWDDAYTINGYLQRAYEGVPNFYVEEIPQDAILEPVYSEEVLMQIENSNTPITGNMVDLTSCKVTQDVSTNSIVFSSVFTVSQTLETWKQGGDNAPIMVSIRSDSPTVADTTVATRLKVVEQITWDATTSNVTSVQYDTGSEIPLSWSIYYSGIVGTYSSFFFVLNETDYSKLVTQLTATMFDWHPISICVVAATMEDPNQPIVAPMGDLHNVTLIDKITLQNLHRICLYSEFNSFSA